MTAMNKSRVEAFSDGVFAIAITLLVLTIAQPDNYITDGPGATGVITSTVLPQREMQFGLKLHF